MKALLVRILRYLGLDAYQLRHSRIVPPGSSRRPVGRVDTLLQDLKARGLACQTILDVGANQTAWSRTAAACFPEAYLYLIEPQRELEAGLQAFCRKHQNAQYFLTGVGAQKQEQLITIWDDLAGSSFVPEPDETLAQQGKQRRVPVTTIDALIEEGMRMPDLIKMDIQGYELKALRGATLTFGQTEVYILEVALYKFMPGIPLLDEVIEFMKVRGYVAYDFAGFLRRPSDGALAQCDICFVRDKGALRRSNQW
ncbi:MAG: FkbM family methyltransferase [Tunicatimonas sp.]